VQLALKHLSPPSPSPSFFPFFPAAQLDARGDQFDDRGGLTKRHFPFFLFSFFTVWPTGTRLPRRRRHCPQCRFFSFFLLFPSVRVRSCKGKAGRAHEKAPFLPFSPVFPSTRFSVSADGAPGVPSLRIEPTQARRFFFFPFPFSPLLLQKKKGVVGREVESIGMRNLSFPSSSSSHRSAVVVRYAVAVVVDAVASSGFLSFFSFFPLLPLSWPAGPRRSSIAVGPCRRGLRRGPVFFFFLQRE